MKQFLLIFLWITVLCYPCLAQNENQDNQVRYLHVSTNPSYADAYIGNISPDHSTEPDFKLPGFIPVPAGESSITISLFRPEFADTSINVQLSQKDTSFLIVALRPHYDENQTEIQLGELSHRNRKHIGKNLLFTSLVPFLVSGVAGIVTWYEIEKANDEKDKIESTLIRTDNSYQESCHKFKEHRDNARESKNVMKFGLILGGAIFAVGVVLSF